MTEKYDFSMTETRLFLKNSKIISKNQISHSPIHPYLCIKQLMSEDFEEELDYTRIAKAIAFIQQNFKSQPSLDEIAEHINLSSFHFQRLFQNWAGVSPKKFLQFLSLNHAKSLLKNKEQTLFDVAFETGLSGTSRLHDLFIKIEGMTPAEYKNRGEKLVISYSFQETNFGKIIIANTAKGVCHLMFFECIHDAFNQLKNEFPNAQFILQETELQSKVLVQVAKLADSKYGKNMTIRLHIKGTDFQLKVWTALLSIPTGNLTTYGKIAKQIGNENASRAVGTAIGCNPVALLIPCHRVIQASGALGGYMWGTIRKTAIIAYESALNEKI